MPKLGGTPNPLKAHAPPKAASEVRPGAFRKGTDGVWYKSGRFVNKLGVSHAQWVNLSSTEDPSGSAEKARLTAARKRAAAKRAKDAKAAKSPKRTTSKSPAKKPKAKTPAKKPKRTPSKSPKATKKTKRTPSKSPKRAAKKAAK